MEFTGFALFMAIMATNALLVVLIREIRRSNKKGETFMSAITDLLTQIDTKTDSIAADITTENAAIADVQTILTNLQKNQTDPADIAATQAALDKLSGVATNLDTTTATLSAMGKSGTV